jgi:hypothetical protein
MCEILQAQPNVVIPLEEYEKLKADQDFLECLRAAGVDNWQGYEMAMDYYNGDEDAIG